MTIRSYAEAEEFLNGFINYEKLLGGKIRYDTKEFDLENFQEMLRRFDNPQLQYSAIHVAGTKGKGSTCAFLAAILQAAGYRVGLYTSPHIESYLERIKVNGQPIPEAGFCRLLSDFASAFESLGTPSSSLAKRAKLELGVPRHKPDRAETNFRTVFELLTACAFVWFAMSEVEIAIVETGLGGRLDATNVFHSPPVCEGGFLANVITPIAFDHTAILGESIAEIAAEKAGIIRPHAFVISAGQPAQWGDTVYQVLQDRIRELGGKTPVTRATECDQLRWDVDVEKLERRLVGDHQLANLQTALRSLNQLAAAGHLKRITEDSIRSGVADAWLPGRCEIVSSDPLIVIDGAHCCLSAAALGRTLKGLLPAADTKVTAVAAFMRDKDIAGIWQALSAEIAVEQLICCTMPLARAASAQEASEILSAVATCPVVPIPDVHHAVKFAMQDLEPDDALVIFGSMFLVAPALKAVNSIPGAPP